MNREEQMRASIRELIEAIDALGPVALATASRDARLAASYAIYAKEKAAKLLAESTRAALTGETQ